MAHQKEIQDTRAMATVIRNNLGQIQSLIAENLGCDTNNSAELWGLIKGVQMTLDQNLTCLIIEGDSKIIIDLATKILNGRDPGKITPSWRLLGPLYSFQALLRPSLTLTPSHIRRSENKVADRLANVGVESMQQIILHDSRQSQSSPSGSNARSLLSWMALIWTRCHLCLLRISSKSEMIRSSGESTEEHQLAVDLGTLAIGIQEHGGCCFPNS
jgi:ribonuclease HI